MRVLVFNKDHPKLNTGYAKSLNEIWIKRLSKKQDIGIYETVPATAFFDEINNIPIFTSTTAGDAISGEDSLLRLYNEFSANLYFTEVDFFVFNRIFDFSKDKKINWFYFVPIDFDPVPDFVIDKLKSAACIIPMCKWAKQKLGKKLDNVSDYIYHGVDTSIYKPFGNSKAEIRRKFAPKLVSEGDFLIVLVQKNAANKAYVEQLQGIKLFIDQNPNLNVKIYIHAFPMGQFRLFELVKSFGLEKNCAFADPYRYLHCLYKEKDLALFYNLADVCLNASAEGFGLPTLEAMACGTPVIGLNWGASAELLEVTPELRVKIGEYKNISNGIRKPFPKPEDIAKKLALIAKKGSESYAKKVSNYAEKFSWDKTAEQINKIIETCNLSKG
jgi:glycosyltransferase involved in cell wall biosynthesis